MENEIMEGLTPEQQALLNQAVEEAHSENTETIDESHQEIPVNSNTINIQESTSRFSSAVWFDTIQNQDVVVAGIGGIGSHTVFLLSRCRPHRLYLFDDDVVEGVNLSGQLFANTMIKLYKVTAIGNMISNFSSYNHIYEFTEKYDDNSETANIMICGFDNMEARYLFFHKWKNHVNALPEEERYKCLYIDGRLTAEFFQILCIQGDDEYNIDRYEREFLFSSREAEQTICSYKQTTFCASMIASYIVNLFVNFCANIIEGDNKPLIKRDLPFYTEYNAETMYLKTEA